MRTPTSGTLPLYLTEYGYFARGPRSLGEFDNHPLSVAGRALLESRGEAELLRDRAREILAAGNENPDGFRVTSSYVVAAARR